MIKVFKFKYGFIYGMDKSNINICKLCNVEWVKYEIYNVVKSVLRMVDSWDEFKSEFVKWGVYLEFVYKDKEWIKV